ncbi:hypothetical protein P7K49_008272 [Saguinus oedipus]|uniref:Uncharacterized protein n=1 Tax=Saguinus oedipus TaxID=9490 RepID=A0ABQ9VXZ8_SAGOE|nr:hypothetical protein P7K49_008272 [Saguinus oedipus]
MAEKRRGSPCSMLSLKAHAFSVEALIGAEKQQQLQKKRRKLGAEEAAGAVEDGGGGAGEKGSSKGDEGAALPPPTGAASGPARSGADLERVATGELALSYLTSPRREPELLRVCGYACAPRPYVAKATQPRARWPCQKESSPHKLVTLQTVKMPLPALPRGRPPPTRRPAPSATAVCCAWRYSSVLQHLPPLGFQPMGALFSFLTFKSIRRGGGERRHTPPRNRNKCPKPFVQTRKRAAYLQTWFPGG